jgi:hypothetical protein
MARRLLFHLDLDEFIAAVERLRHPELEGKPIVVGGDGDPTKRGVVSTASYEARAFGIRSAMPLRTAYKRNPDAIFLPVDADAYRETAVMLDALRPFDAGRGAGGTRRSWPPRPTSPRRSPGRSRSGCSSGPRSGARWGSATTGSRPSSRRVRAVMCSSHSIRAETMFGLRVRAQGHRRKTAKLAALGSTVGSSRRGR